MSKKTMVIVPTWDPDEPRFVVADAPEHISDDRKFVDGKCIENQRLGIVYSVEDIVYALNNSDIDKLSKENKELKNILKNIVYQIDMTYKRPDPMGFAKVNISLSEYNKLKEVCFNEDW